MNKEKDFDSERLSVVTFHFEISVDSCTVTGDDTGRALVPLTEFSPMTALHITFMQCHSHEVAVHSNESVMVKMASDVT